MNVMIFKQLKNLLVITLFFITVKAVSQPSEKPFSIDDAFNLKNVRSPKISPDGKWIAFTVRAVSYTHLTLPTILLV